MAVSARTVNSLTEAANARHEALVGAKVRAGTYSLELGDEVMTGWHSHEYHQLEYAVEGVAEVETDTARYLLPPRQAVWIPAGVEHSSTLTHVKAVSVFFDPEMVPNAGDRVRILAAAPVLREMIRYARRWPISRSAPDPVADAFFAALALLVGEWLDDETPLSLPTTTDPLVAAAIEYIDQHLADATLRDVCSAIGASERSLRRAFVNATGMSWRQYLQESRLLKAMALLAEGDHSTLTIAMSVGFESASAFTRAFHRYAGETPKSYRRRTRALPPPDEWDEEEAFLAIQKLSRFDEPEPNG
jgi:AraC-like DNA-binding protein/quercetin dioxygenase-like cupin family protein